MRLVKCDECGATETLSNPFDSPASWLTVKEGNEDEVTFDTMTCLAAWAFRQSADQVKT